MRPDGRPAPDPRGQRDGTRPPVRDFARRREGDGWGSTMPDRRERVLIAGVSTRALARSAARAGYRVSSIDAFGDMDLRAVATVVALTRETGGFSPDAAADQAARLRVDAVAYTSNFENYPDAVTRLASGRRLLGNPADVLRAVRDPLRLMRALRDRGMPVPLTRASAPAMPRRASAWLLKPRRSGGGHGTRVWRGGACPAPGVSPAADSGRARLRDLPRRRPTSASARHHPPAGGPTCVRRGRASDTAEASSAVAGRRSSTTKPACARPQWSSREPSPRNSGSSDSTGWTSSLGTVCPGRSK